MSLLPCGRCSMRQIGDDTYFRRSALCRYHAIHDMDGNRIVDPRSTSGKSTDFDSVIVGSIPARGTNSNTKGPKGID